MRKRLRESIKFTRVRYSNSKRKMSLIKLLEKPSVIINGTLKGKSKNTYKISSKTFSNSVRTEIPKK